MAAPTFGSSTSTFYGTTTSTDVPVPAGVVKDSLVLVFVYIEGTFATLTPPTGFTEITFGITPQTTTSAMGTRVYWKRATGADSGVYSFTGASTITQAVGTRWEGVTTTGIPFELPNAAIRDSSGTTTPAVSLTTTGADRTQVFWAATYAAPSYTPPTGYTELYDPTNGLYVAAVTQPTAGATGSVTAVASVAAAQVAVLIPLVGRGVTQPTASVYPTTVAATTGSTWAGTTNATGSAASTYATWTSTTSGATGTISLSGFGAQAAVGSTAPGSIDSVSVTVKSFVTNTTNVATLTAQLYSGTTALGSAQALTRATTSTIQTLTFTSVKPTWAQLADMRVTISATRAANTSAGVLDLDYVGMAVNYTAPATLPLTDAFTGTDGASWTFPWTTVSGTQTIATNRGQQTTPVGTYVASEARLNVPSSTVRVEATMRFTTTTNRSQRVNVRWDPSTGNGYRIICTPDYNGISIMRVTGFAETTLAEVYDFTYAANTDYRLIVEATGTTVRTKIYAVGASEPSSWKLTTTDATYTSGDVSLVTTSLGTSASVTGLWDDFYATTTVSADVAPPTNTLSTAGLANANPERGFFYYTETHYNADNSGHVPLTTADLTTQRNTYGWTQVFRYYVMEKFRTQDSIDQAYLNLIAADFAAARAAGMKMVARFTYSTAGNISAPPYNDDAPVARVITHIYQLASTLNANADILDALEAGFIGMWGEWYYTDNFGDLGTLTTQNWADRKAVVDTLLSQIDPRVYVLLRYVGTKRRLVDENPSNVDYGPRLGFHNDAFLASSDDYGTYTTFSTYTEAQNKAWLQAHNAGPYPQGGESAAVNAPRSNYVAPVAYRYFRFQPSVTRTPASTNDMQIGEFAVLDGTTRLIGMTVTAIGQDSPASELPVNAADGDLSTKWLNNNLSNPGYYLRYDFGSPVTATGYRLGTANDAPERDPVTWTVGGSNDGTTWTQLDAQSNYAVTTTRQAYLPDFGFMAASAATDLASYRYTFLNPNYHASVLASWGQSGRDDVAQKLGYNLTLGTVTTTQSGSNVTLSIPVVNSGYAAPYRARPLQVVFVSGTTVVTRTLTSATARALAPGTTTITETVAAPPTAGTYAIHLLIPDATVGLQSNPLYSVKALNSGAFDSSTGRNATGTSVTVAATTSTASAFAYVASIAQDIADNVTAWSVTVPTGVTTAHMGVMIFSTANAGSTVAASSGWTSRVSNPAGEANQEVTILTRLGGMVAGQTITGTTSFAAASRITVVWYDTGSRDIEAVGSVYTRNATSLSTTSFPGVTVAGARDVILVGTERTAGTSVAISSWSPSAPTVDHFTRSTDTSVRATGHLTARFSQAAAGTTPTYVATYNASGTNAVGVQFVLAPATGTVAIYDGAGAASGDTDATGDGTVITATPVWQGAGDASGDTNATGDGTVILAPVTYQGAGTASGDTDATGDGTVSPFAGGSGSGDTDASGSGWLVVQGAGTASADSSATGDGTRSAEADPMFASAEAYAFGDGTTFSPSEIVSYTRLTGTFVDDFGDPVIGSVVLTPEVRYRLDKVNKRIVALEPQVIELVDGLLSTVVPSNGPYWHWRCEIIREDTPRREAFYFTIPIGTATIDIADCVFGAADAPDSGPVSGSGTYQSVYPATY